MSKDDLNNSPNGMSGNSNGHYNGSHNQPGVNNTLPGSYSDTDDEIDVKKLIVTLWRNKFILVGITLLGILAAGIYLHYATPIYSSSGSMVIAEARNRYSYTGSDLSNLLTSTYGIGAGSTISNELEILRSRRMSNEIAEKIMDQKIQPDGKMMPILWRDWPTDSTMVEVGTVASRIRNTATYERISREADLVRVSFESPSPFEAQFVVDTIMDTYSSLSTEQNRMSATAAKDFLENELEVVIANLEASENKLKDFMDRTGLVQVDEQSKTMIAQLSTLEQERQKLRVQVATMESAIAAYENQLEQITPGLADKLTKSPGATINRFQYRLAELETERLLIYSRNPELNRADVPPSEIQRIDSQIEAVSAEINKLTTDLLAEDDVFISLLSGSEGGISSRISRLRENILERTLQKSQLIAQIEVLDRQINRYDEQFDNLPEHMVEFARLRRDMTITERLYVTMNQQYSEVSLWEQTQFGLGRPLDYGNLPFRPVKPRSMLILLVGTIIGGMLGIGLIFLKEMLNQNIRSVDEIKRGGMSLLSVIPNMDVFVNREFDGEEYTKVQGDAVSTHLITLLDNISPSAESFRRLKNNIVFAHPDKHIQTIMMTSSTMGEGKTTAVANLAVTFAEAGKKVVMLDLDFRRPALHKMFGKGQRPGITEYLFGEATLDQAKQQTVIDGVTLLACGNRPPDPAAVVQSKKLRELIMELKKEYDYVILDTAPYGIITDAAPIMAMSDGIILLSRFNYTNRDHFNHTLDNLKHVNAFVLGTVLTAFDPKHSTDYYSQDYYKKSYYAAAEYK